ncbi:hypothetical protein MMC14_002937 [Varicellaria rhodocarpa]|nr:hypothetical protein [Varicellaria rhodocarpa]
MTAAVVHVSIRLVLGEVDVGVEVVTVDETDSNPGPSDTGVADVTEELAESEVTASVSDARVAAELEVGEGITEVVKETLGPGPSGSGVDVVGWEGLTTAIDVVVDDEAVEISDSTVTSIVVAEVALVSVSVEKTVSVSGGTLLGATVTVLVAPELCVTVSTIIVGEA